MELKFDKCMECGRQFTGYAGLSKHLPQAHPGITNQEYYDKYYKQPGEGICPVCGNPTQFSGRLNRGYYAHCSKQCTSLDKKVDAKRRATKKELYGSETFNNHDKTTQTKLERYGDANYANGDQIRQTKLDRYGLAGYNNVAKREATKLERFGDANFVNPEKGMATKQAKYGDAHYNNSAKMQETKLDKYGNSSFVNPDKARATVKRKTIEKYNRLIGKQCDVLDYNPRIIATRHVALDKLASAYCPYRLPVNGLHLPEHGQLVSVLVLLQLILDIRCNFRRIFACRVDIVASAPKFPALVFELKRGKPLVQHQAALPL